MRTRPDIAAAGSRWFQCGFVAYDAEGSMVPEADPAALLEFAGQLSPALGSYIRFRAGEDPQRVVDDAVIEMRWEDLRLRLERWEAFARDHPDLPETKSEIEPEIQGLAQLQDRASRYYPLISHLLHNHTITQQDRPLFAKFGLGEPFNLWSRQMTAH